jgi:predicted RNA-binding protein (virulence factor B family)
MAKRIRISVPTPCHEKWQDMTPAEKGRFCLMCQKTVRDFTRSSNREIAEAIKEPKTCGRFLSSQLERELMLPQQKSSLWLAAGAAVMSFLALGSNEAIAQTKAPVEQLSCLC